MQTGRGASGGSVWLSRQTPLHRRYSALKLIKHQTLSLHISNAGVLEQAAAYISLLMLHSDYCATTTLLPCLNGACAVTWNNPRFWTFEIDIASNARVSEFPPLAVPALMLSESGSNAVTAMHTQELFCNISLHGERTVVNHDRFILQFRAKFSLLFPPTRLWQN